MKRGTHPNSLLNLRLCDKSGARNPGAVLSEKEVQAARLVMLQGGASKTIAKFLGVKVRTIELIRAGKTWSSVPWPTRKEQTGVGAIDAYTMGVSAVFESATRLGHGRLAVSAEQAGETARRGPVSSGTGHPIIEP